MRLSVATDVGHVRTRNEDAYCAVELPGGAGNLLAVADGMGGHRG
ncbi:MAG: serine/threonine-protein phosphatase, partial [Clostridia bacterium]|nr:serine/threonine-protein phosphatase [Clostridia bacterium]